MGLSARQQASRNPITKGNETMYWIEDENGHRQPRANAPRVRITNLQEVFGMLDAGTDPCIAHAEYADGDTLDVSYRDPDGHRKTVEEMVKETDEADRRLGYHPTWVGPTTRRLEYGLDRYKAHRLERLDRRDVKRALGEELRRGGLPDTFHYPCHTDKGTIWCNWCNIEDRTKIMLKPAGGKGAKQTGWLNRTRGRDGLRWWWWETMDGAKGEQLPSYQQALLDFIDSTNLGLRRY